MGFMCHCAQNTSVPLKLQNIVEETQALYGIKQSPDRFLKHCWLLTVFTNELHSSHQPSETHKLSDGGRFSPLGGFPLDTVLLCRKSPPTRKSS